MKALFQRARTAIAGVIAFVVIAFVAQRWFGWGWERGALVGFYLASIAAINGPIGRWMVTRPWVARNPVQAARRTIFVGFAIAIIGAGIGSVAAFIAPIGTSIMAMGWRISSYWQTPSGNTGVVGEPPEVRQVEAESASNEPQIEIDDVPLEELEEEAE